MQEPPYSKTLHASVISPFCASMCQAQYNASSKTKEYSAAQAILRAAVAQGQTCMTKLLCEAPRRQKRLGAFQWLLFS